MNTVFRALVMALLLLVTNVHSLNIIEPYSSHSYDDAVVQWNHTDLDSDADVEHDVESKRLPEYQNTAAQKNLRLIRSFSWVGVSFAIMMGGILLKA